MALQARTQYFYELTPERILSAFEQAGLRCQPAVRFLNSLENRVAQVEDEDGERWVGKFYRPGRHSRAAILEEHAFLQELKAAGLPVIPPLPLGNGATGTLGETAGIFFAVFPHHVGRAPDEFDFPKVDELGDLLARLHRVGGQASAQHRRAWDTGRLGEDLLATLEEDGAMPPDLHTRYVKAARRVIAFLKPRLASIPMHRIHGDFHRGNLLWSSLGPTLVDFDDMTVGPPVQDVWMLLPDRDSEGVAMRETLLHAYEKHLPFDRATLALIEPLRAFRYVRYAAWLAARRQDPAFARVLHDFGTRSWWQRELGDLEAQLSFFK